jgi:hypothetical protein
MSCDIPVKDQFAFPWYKKGLNFACTQCGKCCTGAPGYVWVTELEILGMAEFLKISVPDFKKFYTKRLGQKYLLVERKSQGHSCVFYKDNRCQVYAARPLQCRAYPFWKENIHSEESWKQTAHECEGIHDEAPLVPFEAIEKWIQDQRTQNPDEHFVSN